MKIINEDTALTRRKLPHLEREGASYFITLRLRGSLPLNARMAELLRSCKSIAQLDEFVQQHSKGPMWLATQACALAAMQAFQPVGQKYARVECFTIMPNHLHAILTPYEGVTLSKVLKYYKQISSYHCLRASAAIAPFWEEEPYDHILRKGERAHLTPYILENPVKAGFCAHWTEWPYSYLLERMEGF
jgi:REP element-mobilizing transposase RayT